MVTRVLKVAIIVIAVYAVMHSPGAAAENVLKAGEAAIRLLGTVVERAATFVEALLR